MRLYRTRSHRVRAHGHIYAGLESWTTTSQNGPRHLSSWQACAAACSRMATAEAPGSDVSCRGLSGTYERPALASMPWVWAAPAFAACAAADGGALTSLPAQELDTLAKCECMHVVSLTLGNTWSMHCHMMHLRQMWHRPACLAQLVAHGSCSQMQTSVTACIERTRI